MRDSFPGQTLIYTGRQGVTNAGCLDKKAIGNDSPFMTRSDSSLAFSPHTSTYPKPRYRKSKIRESPIVFLNDYRLRYSHVALGLFEEIFAGLTTETGGKK